MQPNIGSSFFLTEGLLKISDKNPQKPHPLFLAAGKEGGCFAVYK